MRRFRKFFLVIILLIVTNSISQTKNEKEYRIDLNELPLKTQSITPYLPKKIKRIKFYKEIDGDRISYEIKFKYFKHHYSLEFNTLGEIEDIEVQVSKNQINNIALMGITKYFDKKYTRFKIIKIQKQYLYDNSKSFDTFIENIILNNSSMPSNFEIIAEVKSNGNRAIKEFTFNNEGVFLHSRELTITSYEHVLY